MVENFRFVHNSQVKSSKSRFLTFKSFKCDQFSSQQPEQINCNTVSKETKHIIIQAAIKLFNERGIKNVRVQDIAEEAGISPGNLTYHFPTKKDLMPSVRRYMMKTLDTMAFANRLFEEGIEGMKVVKSYLEYLEKFRFFYLDMLEIMREYPEIRTTHQQQIDFEVESIKNLIQYVRGKDYLQPEAFDGQYEALANQIWMTMHFWLLNREVRGEKTTGINEGLMAVANLFYPHCTAFGRKKYEELKGQVYSEVFY